MRFLIATTAALAVLLTTAGAGAYELRASLKAPANDPTTATVGQSFVYEVFLDTTNTQATSRITLLSVSFGYDPLVIAYDPVNSYTEEYYPLYAPGQPNGKTVDPATFLVPFFNPPRIWLGTNPPGIQQLTIDFKENNLGTTVAMDTNLKIAQVAFNTIGVGVTSPDFSIRDNTGGTFQIDVVTNISAASYAGPEVIDTILQNGTTITVPEPGTAGLALGALGALGVLVARQRRR